MLKTWFDHYIFANIHIACCAIAMCSLTYATFKIPINATFLGFVFCATLCSYGAHFYLSHSEKTDNSRAFWSSKNKNTLLIISLLGGLFSFFLFLSFSSFWREIFFIGLLTFLYTAPKILFAPFTYLKGYAFAKTLYLAFSWTYVTVFLPLQISYFFKNHSENMPFLAQASSLYSIIIFIYIFQICMLFDYRDREDDGKLRIKNLVTYLKPSAFRVLFLSVGFLLFFTLYLLHFQDFSVKTLTIFAFSEILLCLQMPYAMRSKSDYYYYFVLDSMMLLPSFAAYLA